MQHWLVQPLEILWIWFHQTLRSLTGFVAFLSCDIEGYLWCIKGCAIFIFPWKACFFLHYLVLGPIEAVAVLGLLWREIGASSLAGMGLLFIMVPMQIKMGDALMYFRLVYFIIMPTWIGILFYFRNMLLGDDNYSIVVSMNLYCIVGLFPSFFFNCVRNKMLTSYWVFTSFLCYVICLGLSTYMYMY